MWSLTDIINATNGHYQGGPTPSQPSTLPNDLGPFFIDSRSVVLGGVYIALKGARHNGHDYVQEVINQGAALAIVDQPTIKGVGSDHLIVVPDTFQALQSLARYQRPRLSHTHFIGITGSAGKTTTKEMARLVLSTYGTTHANEKSFNTPYGLPLTLINCPLNAQYGVFELGMSHAGEISYLTNLLQPDTAMITNIGPAHIENFENLAGIARAKAEIFEGVPIGGGAILFGDQPESALLQECALEHQLKTSLYGEGAICGNRLTKYTSTPPSCTFEGRLENTHPFTASLGMHGKHFALNALGVLTLVQSLGLPIEPALMALKAFSGAVERGQTFRLQTQHGPVTLIDESYNANPYSVAAALGRFAESPSLGRRIFVMGDMKELGPNSPNYHAALAESIEEANIDMVYACGSETPHLLAALSPNIKRTHCPTAPDLIPQILSDLQDHDSLMVKGSLSMGMKCIVEALLKLDQTPQKEQKTSAV